MFYRITHKRSWGLEKAAETLAWIPTDFLIVLKFSVFPWLNRSTETFLYSLIKRDQSYSRVWVKPANVRPPPPSPCMLLEGRTNFNLVKDF